MRERSRAKEIEKWSCVLGCHFLFIMRHKGENSMSHPQGISSKEGLEGGSAV